VIANTDPSVYVVICDDGAEEHCPVLAWADDGHPMILDHAGLVRVEHYHGTGVDVAPVRYHLGRCTLVQRK
jgi:hypothetical protein